MSHLDLNAVLNHLRFLDAQREFRAGIRKLADDYRSGRLPSKRLASPEAGFRPATIRKDMGASQPRAACTLTVVADCGAQHIFEGASEAECRAKLARFRRQYPEQIPFWFSDGHRIEIH